ncbi:MAG: protein kinase [Leptolyngbyaceae cyanobacterium]
MASSSISNQDSQDNSAYPAQNRPLVGGRYAVLKQLSEGAFGHTFVAEDTHLPGRPQCVLKQLKPQSGRKATAMARRLFEQEAEVLYTLGNHPQVPQLLAHFEDRNGFYLAQEYIEGRSLSEELKQSAPIPEVRAIQLVREILEVLVFVHQQQVIHRDLKPANLIRRQVDQKIVMIDFGAVKQVSTQFFTPKPGETDYTVAIGTVGYIPNEQLGGRPRYSSDIYAVGIIGIQALTGVAPNQLADDERSGELVWRDRVPSITPKFADFLDKMVRYDFRSRYANATEALEAIVYLGSGQEPSLSTPPVVMPVSPMMPPASTQLEFSHPSLAEVPHPASASSPSVHGMGTPPSGGATPSWGQTQNRYPSQAPSVPTAQTGRSRLQDQLEAGGMAIAVQVWRRCRWLNPWYAIAFVSIVGTFTAIQRSMWSSQQGQFFHSVDTVAPPVVLERAARLVQNLEPEESPEDIARQIDYQITAHQVTAQTLVEAENFEAALTEYQRILSLDSKYLPALTQRCVLLNQLSEPESALSACQDLLVVDPNSVVALWGLGKANQDIAFYDNALDYYNQALAIAPNYVPAQTGRRQVQQAIGQ